MNARYKRYNEITFVSYCMDSIDHAVGRGLKQKERRGQIEISLYDLSENQLLQSDTFTGVIGMEISSDTFEVEGIKIPVVDADLAQALRAMTPQKRNVLLLAYLLDESDSAISRELNLPRTTIRNRRRDALKGMKELMGDME